jgi:inner membrane protein
VTPVVHAELSWLAAQVLAERRDRRLVVLAGLAPDLDGLSVLAGVESYGRWHHVLTHGVLAALVVTLACVLLARRRLATALLAFAAFHLHLVCDLAGSGVGWSITYLWPWSRAEWLWSGAWELNAWPNLVIGTITALACFAAALPLGRTITEVVSARWDEAVVETIRKRFRRGPQGSEERPGDKR